MRYVSEIFEKIGRQFSVSLCTLDETVKQMGKAHCLVVYHIYFRAEIAKDIYDGLCNPL